MNAQNNTNRDNEWYLKDFMWRVNKLSVGRSTSDELFGRVTCKSYAVEKGSYGQHMNRSKYGTRKFTVSGSKLIANGKYTFKGLREKIQKNLGM